MSRSENEIALILPRWIRWMDDRLSRDGLKFAVALFEFVGESVDSLRCLVRQRIEPVE